MQREGFSVCGTTKCTVWLMLMQVAGVQPHSHGLKMKKGLGRVKQRYLSCVRFYGAHALCTPVES